MRSISRFVAGVATLLAAGPVLATPSLSCASATMVRSGTNPTTGHYFEVYAIDGVSWDFANTCANASSYQGVQGHLATITSSGENTYVDQLRHDALGQGLVQPQTWVGGLQDGGGWRWVNEEGPFPAVNDSVAYANWAPGEPNNSGGVESHLTMGRYDSGGPWVDGGWNDEGAAPGSIGGYIVEYDLPRPAACSGSTCQTIDGQILSLPPAALTPGATLNFNAFEFTDPRVASGRCGVDPLVLFGPAYGRPELRIPPYLCGSPQFVVVFVDTRNADGSPLEFPSGTVFIENDTQVVLPDNTPYACKDTKGPIFPTQGENPQFQDIVVYQTTDPARMLEDLPGNQAQDPQFAGAASEVTNGCGSSRGAGKETSYFVVGMHIDFGALGATEAGWQDRFVALSRYKLTLLQQSVALARTAGALKNGDATKMSAQLDNAVKKLDRGDSRGALGHVQQFLKFVNAARYTPVPENNYNGEHLMRGQNIEFTLRVKVVPNRSCPRK